MAAGANLQRHTRIQTTLHFRQLSFVFKNRAAQSPNRGFSHWERRVKDRDSGASGPIPSLTSCIFPISMPSPLPRASWHHLPNILSLDSLAQGLLLGASSPRHLLAQEFESLVCPDQGLRSLLCV